MTTPDTPVSPTYDPTLKTEIRNLLYRKLFEPIERLRREQLTQLVMRNAMICSATHKSFIYKGVVYNEEMSPPQRPVTRLTPGLRPEMEAWLREQQQLEREEIPRVLGSLMRLLNSTDNLSDLVFVLPETLREPLKEIQLRCPCTHSARDANGQAQLRAQLTEDMNQLRERLMKNTLL